MSNSRREFLSTTSALAGAMLFASSARAEDTPRELRLGVMGMGRGKSLATTFGALPGVKIKTICDVAADRLSSAQGELEKPLGAAPATVEDFRRILDDPEIDALVVAAPNHWHAPAAILACAAGKHVYVEKPCSHTPWEGETLVAAARKHRRVVQMGNQRRSVPGFQAAIQQLRDGAIGKVYLSRAWYVANRGTTGRGQPAAVPAGLNYDLWQGPAPRTPYVTNRLPYLWHWFWQWGNGELGNNGVHALDICRWGLGVDYPLRVTSSGGRFAFDDDQQTPDTHTVCFEFAGGRQAVWEGLSCNTHGPFGATRPFVSFYGEKGALDIDDSSYRIYDNADKKTSEVPLQLKDADHAANFVAAIRADDPTQLNSEILEGHRSTLLCHLGNIAHRTGRTLNCRPEDGRILNDEAALKLWERAYEPGWEPKV